MTHVVLASRSPRRQELLGLLVPAERRTVCAPPSPDEALLEALSDRGEILAVMTGIVRHKAATALTAWRAGGGSEEVILIAADTTVLVENGPGRVRSLGQPPADDWRATVRGWFENYYLGRTHEVVTALRVERTGDGRVWERTVATRVTMGADRGPLIDAYLASGESVGKAGGYALQGLGSVFIDRVEGSLSNVVGLPLEALTEVLGEADSSG